MSEKVDKFSPFLRLYKYRPTSKSTPKENFVTESFAICLHYNPDIAKLFLKEFLNIEAKEIDIDTQVSHEGSIFDLTMTESLIFHIVVENKMGAAIGKKDDEDIDQLDKYMNLLADFQIDNKHLMLIDIGDLTIKESRSGVNYKAIRWNDIKVFLEKQSGNTEVGELFRVSFVDLLKHLKVDRKIIKGKLSWKCDICGSEMIGQGIYSHRKKHVKDYGNLINDKNDKMRSEFNKRISSYQKGFKIIEEEIRNIPKIEKSNYADSEKITAMLTKHLPKEIWVYFISKIPYCFSNKAFSDYQKSVESKLKSEKINLISEPAYLMTSYENILNLLNGQKYGA